MINFKEILVIIIVSTIAATSSIFELFKISSFIGAIFTAISIVYFPAFLLAIFVTQRADPPGQIGIAVGALVQTSLMYVLFRFIRRKYGVTKNST